MTAIFKKSLKDSVYKFMCVYVDVWYFLPVNGITKINLLKSSILLA